MLDFLNFAAKPDSIGHIFRIFMYVYLITLLSLYYSKKNFNLNKEAVSLLVYPFTVLIFLILKINKIYDIETLNFNTLFVLLIASFILIIINLFSKLIKKTLP
jgi:hypothetical protein